ncbi:MAG: DUF2071 domain-containing protein [Acidimicrobiales bacterium]|nr:MAG: DUF2071 domain-containing protein [Acidimicrobiales bacterium]
MTMTGGLLTQITPDPPGLAKRVVMTQQWTELAYLHWSYDPAEVQRLLPDGITVDTFEGRAWVGLIPFEMRDVRLRPAPVLPWVGNFIEINVRTYVTDRFGRRAVWFFSLDVPRSLVVGVARTAFALPYCWAKAGHERTDDRHHYWMTRRWPTASPARADMRFRVGDRIADADVSDLDHFLSARWALLTTRGSRVEYGRVEHPRWPLHHVHDVEITEDALVAAGLPSPEGKPHALYSPGVDVRLAWLDKITNEETP